MSQKTNSMLLFVTLALVIQGCGFQLRGMSSSDLPPFISPVYIQGFGQHHPMRAELTQQLERGATTITSNKKEASGILQLSNYNSDRRVLSVDGNGKVTEFELYERVQFRMENSEGKELVENQSVSVIRSYINTDEEVLGKQQEEEMLRMAMRRELAEQILRRLQTQLK